MKLNCPLLLEKTRYGKKIQLAILLKSVCKFSKKDFDEDNGDIVKKRKSLKMGYEFRFSYLSYKRFQE